MTEANDNTERGEHLHAWLARVLGTSTFALVSAAGDASFRRYYRLQQTGEPTRVVMDAPPEHVECQPYLRAAELLRSAGVNVPEILASDLALGFLLLSDLGTTHYLDQLDATNADRLYGDAMGALLSIQAGVSPETLPAYDEALLRFELSLFPEWFLERHLGIRLKPAEQDMLEECFQFLCDAALSQPTVFVHRDYHSRNLMLNAHHNPGVLDFQDAVRGPVSYDVVSLFRDVYVRWPPERVGAWVAGYHDLALQHGVLEEEDPAVFDRWLDLTGVQRHLKIAGIFARLYHRDGKPGYLADIPAALRYVAEVSANYPPLAPLHSFLSARALEAKLADRNRTIPAPTP